MFDYFNDEIKKSDIFDIVIEHLAKEGIKSDVTIERSKNLKSKTVNVVILIAGIDEIKYEYNEIFGFTGWLIRLTNYVKEKITDANSQNLKNVLEE